jgi:hypothetical protein
MILSSTGVWTQGLLLLDKQLSTMYIDFVSCYFPESVYGI